VDGKMNRFFQEVCLLEQPFVKDPDRAVGDIVHAAVAKMGENIRIRRFARFGLGEGLEQRRVADAVQVEARAGTEAR
jgi:elongation factor Ts